MTNELTKNQHKKSDLIYQKIPFLFILTSIIVLLLSASALATPTILSDTGSDVYIKGTSTLLDDADLTIKIYTVASGGSDIYSENFTNAIQDGKWGVTLGINEVLNLDYMTRYYKEILINNELVIFTNYLGEESTRTIFDSSFGYTTQLPGCSDGEIAKYNLGEGIWDCSENKNSTLPICSAGNILRYNSSLTDWDCVSEKNELPNCAEDKTLSVISGSWNCKDPISDLSELADTNNILPTDISHLTDHLNTLIPDYNDLINLPPNLDTNSANDFSGNYNDLEDLPIPLECTDTETIKWDNTLDKWDCANDNMGDTLPICLSNQILAYNVTTENWTCQNTAITIPDDCTDTETIKWDNTLDKWDCADDTNTQLSQSEVSDFMILTHPLLDTNSTDDLELGDVVNSIGNWSEDKTTYYNKSDIEGKDFLNTSAIEGYATELFVNDSISSINYSDINNLPAFTGWDTNDSDDFDGNYTSLMDKPIFGEGFTDSSGTISLRLGGGLDLTHDGNLTLNLPEDSLLSLDHSSGELVYDNTTYLKNDGDSSTGNYLFDYVDYTFTIDSVNNKVGIGTKYPEYDVHIQTDTNSSLKYGFLLQNPNTTLGSSVGVLFGTDSNVNYTKGALVYERNNTYGRGDFHFLQEDNPSSSIPDLTQAVLTIKNTGNVGIGDKSPAVKLDVDGLIRTSPRSSATCNTKTEGSIYYDSDTKLFFGCNSTTWVRFN